MGKINEMHIDCSDTPIREYPELRFGNAENGDRYFDVTYFLSHAKDEGYRSVDIFLSLYSFQIESLKNAYGLDDFQLRARNTDRHELLHGALCYLFISYVDRDFTAYVNEMTDDLLTRGFAVSDTFIANSARERLSKDLLKQLSEQK